MKKFLKKPFEFPAESVDGPVFWVDVWPLPINQVNCTIFLSITFLHPHFDSNPHS